MTNYKRYETITAGELRKMHGLRCRFLIYDYIGKGTIVMRGNHIMCADFFIGGGDEGFSTQDYHIRRIEIEQPEELDLNHLNGSIDSKLVFTQNDLDDNEIINEGLDRLYGGGIEKLPLVKTINDGGYNNIAKKINELIDSVNKQQQIIDDLIGNIK